MPGESRVLRALAFVGRPAGVKADCGTMPLWGSLLLSGIEPA